MPSVSTRPPRVVVISEIPTPYRLPLYARLAARADLELDVLFCSAEQPNRPWQLDDELDQVPHAVLPGFGLRVGRRRNTFVYEINPSILRELSRRRPDVLVVGGYAVFAEQVAIAFARARRVPYLLHSESQLIRPRSAVKRAAKRTLLPTLIGGAAGGLAVGSGAARYLAHYGLPAERVRIFPNTIDVARQRERAAAVRANADAVRSERGLPDRYWLFAGRLVEAKGIPELVAALRAHPAPPPLLVAGEGPLAAELRREDGVRVLGFQQPDDLVGLMALAELTIVPSRVEPWGVVVNESLAAGCPVVVSDAVGAAEDLVRDGTNGRIFRAGDVGGLVEALSAPVPSRAREPGPIDRWDYAFAEEQFLEAIELARAAR